MTPISSTPLLLSNPEEHPTKAPGVRSMFPSLNIQQELKRAQRVLEATCKQSIEPKDDVARFLRVLNFT